MNAGKLQRIKESYRKHAPNYDAHERVPEKLRPLAIERLALKPGDTVIDLGCGTGLSFPLLEERIGPRGEIVGVELTPEMLSVARQRISAHGWRNIRLIEGNAEEVDLPNSVDGILAFFTPHITASTAAMERALAALKPGGRLVACGAKRAEGWRGIPVNIWFQWRYRSWRFVPAWQVFFRMWRGHQPYETLHKLTSCLEREDYLRGCTYIALVVKSTAHSHR